MNKKYMIFTILSILIFSAQNINADPPSPVIEKINKLLSSAKVVGFDEQSKQYNDLSMTTFWYTPIDENSDEYPYYGGGIAVWNKNELIWHTLLPGDFTFHTVHWIDFDGDTRKDILAFAGLEDVFYTMVFRCNAKKDIYEKDNFIQVYYNGTQYSVIYDVNNDGKPEIFETKTDPSKWEEFHEDECFDLDNLDTKQIKEITAEHIRISNKLDKYNFDYNMPDTYFLGNMAVFEDFIFYNLSPEKQKTSKTILSEHLKWRINFLKNAKQKRPECAEKYESIIKVILNNYP